MLKTGLCSITFRQLSAEEIIELAVKAGIEGVEWGSDVHVPAGDLIRAKEVAERTEQADLEITSYGSYYRAGESNMNAASFEDILQTAIKLGAPSIRIWAGRQGSNEADAHYREEVISDARRVASMASEHDISINFEYHGGTLTDTKESARQLMKEVHHENVGIYWQPEIGRDSDYRMASIKDIQDWLTHVHVFHWEGTDRLPLKNGKEEWESYIKLLKETSQKRYLMLEFVKGDDQEQFFRDAEVLKGLLN